MRKQILMKQKSTRERELADRLKWLSGKGIDTHKADKDPIVRKLKASIKASSRRLSRIADIEERTEEMARIKAEKMAAPKKKEEEGAKAPKKKAGPQDGKIKKPKAPKKDEASEKSAPAAVKQAEGTKEGSAALAKTGDKT